MVRLPAVICEVVGYPMSGRRLSRIPCCLVVRGIEPLFGAISNNAEEIESDSLQTFSSLANDIIRVKIACRSSLVALAQLQLLG